MLALLPLSSSAATAAGQPSLSPSKAPRGSGASGGGPDSSVLRLLWASGGGSGWKKPQGPVELVLAQRTGRLSTAVGGDVVYHLATTVRDPEQIPALAGGLGGNGDGGKGAKTQGQGQQRQQQQEGALAFALLVGHSAEQGCLEATLLAPQGGGLFDARRDAGALRAANGASSCAHFSMTGIDVGLGRWRWD